MFFRFSDCGQLLEAVSMECGNQEVNGSWKTRRAGDRQLFLQLQLRVGEQQGGSRKGAPSTGRLGTG